MSHFGNWNVLVACQVVEANLQPFYTSFKGSSCPIIQLINDEPLVALLVLPGHRRRDEQRGASHEHWECHGIHRELGFRPPLSARALFTGVDGLAWQ